MKIFVIGNDIPDEGITRVISSGNDTDRFTNFDEMILRIHEEKPGCVVIASVCIDNMPFWEISSRIRSEMENCFVVLLYNENVIWNNNSQDKIPYIYVHNDRYYVNIDSHLRVKGSNGMNGLPDAIFAFSRLKSEEFLAVLRRFTK